VYRPGQETSAEFSGSAGAALQEDSSHEEGIGLQRNRGSSHIAPLRVTCCARTVQMNLNLRAMVPEWRVALATRFFFCNK